MGTFDKWPGVNVMTLMRRSRCQGFYFQNGKINKTVIVPMPYKSRNLRAMQHWEQYAHIEHRQNRGSDESFETLRAGVSPFARLLRTTKPPSRPSKNLVLAGKDIRG